MKKNKTRKIINLLMIAMLGLFVSSCNREANEVTPPKNELAEKGHDTPSKVEIIIREGHLHGTMFHGNPEDKNLAILPRVQKVIFTNIDGKIIRKIEKEGDKLLKKDDQSIVVQASNAIRYAMEIKYFNNKGEVINSQFTTLEMAPLHQHFFTVTAYKDLDTDQVMSNGKVFYLNLYDYTYRDTTPTDKMFGTDGVKLSNDPIGLKGYFAFNKTSRRTSFNMKVTLMHLFVSKKNTNGQYDSANHPSDRILTFGTSDFEQKIPFTVIAYQDDNKDYYNDLSKYYQISVDKIKEHLKNQKVDDDDDDGNDQDNNEFHM